MSRDNHHKYIHSTTRVESPFQKMAVILLEIIRLILAAVFIFSGFVKAIDPLGSTYKFEDYLTAFGGFFSQLTFLAFPAAIALSTLELVIGLCFLLKVKLKTTSLIALLFMAIMLPLTLYVAVMNPVTDCGCFGDALIISNWATFYKNIVLTAFVFLLLIFGGKLRTLFLPAVEWIMLLVFVVAGVGLSVFSYRNLPMIDFRPYKVGVNIPEAMKIPEGMPMDKYDTKLIYMKEGVSQEFTLENYPKNDSTWTFVEQKSTLIQKGYEPPIHNFTLVDSNRNDITDEVLHHRGKVHLLIMYDIQKTAEKGTAKTEELYRQAKANGELFYALTASPDEEIAEFSKQHNVTYPFCKTDPITLKTIVRANPGLMTIENGVITGKWNWRDF